MHTLDNLKDFDYWFVGEFPSVQDIKNKRVLGGLEGKVLREMCDEADLIEEDFARIVISKTRPGGWQGLYKTDWFCTKAQALKKGYITYGDKYIHPGLFNEIQQLLVAIKEHKPRLIIGLGELPLLALSGNSGITNWRGSCLYIFDTKFIPTFAPDRVVKMWEWKYLTVHDFKRAAGELVSPTFNFPVEDFRIRPTYEQALAWIADLMGLLDSSPVPVAIGCDIETRSRHITCIGFAEGVAKAFCIPFVSIDGHYWKDPEEEVEIIWQLTRLMTHPMIRCTGQNFPYDIAYIARWWGVWPRSGMDTMTAWHVCYSGLKKSLAFISSMLLPAYSFWKEESHDAKVDVAGEDAYWLYNCKDCARTVALVPYLEKLLTHMNQWDQYEEQTRAARPHLKTVLRGINRNNGNLLQEMMLDTMALATERAEYLDSFTGALTGGQQLTKTKKASPWYRSPTQLATILYSILKLPVQRDRATNRPTTDDAALQKLIKHEPMLKPLLTTLLEYRSLGVFRSTFLACSLDWDGRMYTSYGVGMTETFRDTSSKNAFGHGGNLQNIPKGNELGED